MSFHLIRLKKFQFSRRIGNNIALPRCSIARIVQSVYAYAQHAMVSKSLDKQLPIDGTMLTVVQRILSINPKVCNPMVNTARFWNRPPKIKICATRHRLRLFIVSEVDWPPRTPAPSAKINSISFVAPPVTKVRIRVRAESLKYVYNWVA